MLPFDDILGINDALSEQKSNRILDENLNDLQVQSNLSSEPLQNMVGFTHDSIENIQDSIEPTEQSMTANNDAGLVSIGNSLNSILNVQNQQLDLLRANANVASVDRINSIGTGDVTNNSNTSNSSASTLNQVSNFVTELETLESSINTLNSNVVSNQSSNATQNRNSASSNQLSVENNFETAGFEGAAQEFSKALSNVNPRDLELLGLISNFSTNNAGNTFNSNVNPGSTNNFSIVDNKLGNTIQEIRDGNMSVDNTEINNRVNQTTDNSSNSVANHSELVSALSTAIAQNNQTLVQTINNVMSSSNAENSNSAITLAANNKTVSEESVKKNEQTATNSNDDVVSLLSQISMQLMHLNSAIGSVMRKNIFA